MRVYTVIDSKDLLTSRAGLRVPTVQLTLIEALYHKANLAANHPLKQYEVVALDISKDKLVYYNNSSWRGKEYGNYYFNGSCDMAEVDLLEED